MNGWGSQKYKSIHGNILAQKAERVWFKRPARLRRMSRWVLLEIAPPFSSSPVGRREERVNRVQEIKAITVQEQRGA